MKAKNVIFTAIATLLSIALFSVNVSADSTEGIGIEPKGSLSEEELDNLKAKGFPESVIDDYLFLGHSYQEIQELEFMGAVDKYYKLTETYPADYE